MSKLWKQRRPLFQFLFGAVVAIMFFRWFEHSQVYHPDRRLEATGAELGRPFEEVIITASDGVALHAWFYPAPANSPRARFAVVYCHGNAGNISHRLDVYQALLDTGVNVLAFDYRGFGRSTGRPSEKGTYLDGQAAYQWLRNKGFAGRDIIAYGESLGGGVASELAMREEVAAVILQSTFSCTLDIGQEMFPWLPVRWLSRIKYDTCSKLPNIKVPVLLLHARTDEVIGYHHAEKNFGVANDPKLFVEISGLHNDPLADRKRFIGGVDKLLQLLESSRPQPAPKMAAQ